MSEFISRFGVCAQKVGMSRIYLEDKTVVAITLLKVPNAYVLEKKELEDHSIMVLGVENGIKMNQPQKKQFEKINKSACGLVREFKITKEEADALGETLGAEWIDQGCFVDVQSKSIGKGFAGVMKAHGFKGGPASHGATKFHRKKGSTGTRDKIFKQCKLPKRLGHEIVTIQSQKVVYKDDELGLIGIIGSVPGKKGTWVRVSKAIKHQAIERARG